MTIESGNVFLGISGGEVDRDIDASVDRFWVLSCVDRFGSEARVLVGEVLGFCEVFVLNSGLLLFVEHVDNITNCSNKINFFYHGKLLKYDAQCILPQIMSYFDIIY